MKSVYLLLGPENGEKQTALQKIKADIRKEVGSDPELYRFYPFDADDNQMFSALANSSFFSSARLVIISQAESLTASQTDTLVKYLAHPASDATLVLISEETSIKAQKLTKLIPKEQTTIFWELFDNQKSDWIRSFFRSRGLTITNDAIDTLLELVDNNTAELKTTSSQLAFFWQTEKKQGPIDEDSVETYIQHTRSETAFTLFPALVKRDLDSSLRIIHAILDTGDSYVSIGILAGLLWQFRRLLSISQALQENGDEATAFANATVLGSKAGIRSFRDKNLYRTALKNYSLDQIRDILIMLGEADIGLKGAGDMTTFVWEQLCYGIVVNSGKKTEKSVWTTASTF